MREIKFRAWVVNPRNNIIGGSRLFPGKTEMIYDFLTWAKPDFSTFHIDKCDDIELMQFTGLKDKNGKEIYEGDIIKEHPNGNIAKVEWIDGGFNANFGEYPDWCWSELFCDHSGRIEVIGNIYENPELLEGAKR